MQGIIYKITPEQGKSVIDELREDIYELDVRVTRIEDDLVDYVTYDALDSRLAEYVTTDTVQTISAKKSFVTSDDPIALEIGKSSSSGNYSLRVGTKQDDSIELSSQGDISFTTNGTSVGSYVLSDSGFSYSSNGSRDLGSSNNKWRNAYVSGVLSNGVDSIAVGDIADKQLVATKQDALTQAQLAAVDSGIDSTKVAQIAQNASDITSLDESKVDKVQGKGLSTNDFTDAFESKLEGIEAGAQVNTVTSVAGKVGVVTLGKSDVGLNNVDNTSDLDKPISTATQSALNLKANESEMLAALVGKADLIDGKVPSSQLPSYVDDVVEYASISQFPIEGDSGKIYVALDTNKTYRWGGSSYVEISESLALGETASTAFPGNRGKALEDAMPNKADLVDGKVPLNELPPINPIHEYADLSSFPVSGVVGDMYIAKDTNKQYRYDVTNGYVELSEEDELEILAHNSSSSILLTDAQVEKAKHGKLILSYSFNGIINYLHVDSEGTVSGNEVIYFRGATYWPTLSNGNVPKEASVKRFVATLVVPEKTLSTVSAYQSTYVATDNDNFFASDVDPVANGKRIVREMNVAGKLIPTYSSSDAGKVVKINAQGDGVVLATDEVGNDIEVVEYQTTTALTDEQVAKAQVGKLAIYRNGVLMLKTSEGGNYIEFCSMVFGRADSAGDYCQAKNTYYVKGCTLYTSTKMLANYYSNTYDSITDVSNNFLEDSVVPTSTGKRIVRARNLRKTQDMITPNVYDATATYNVGDMAIYQNQLYKCTTQIATAEAWDATHWQLTNVVEYVKDSEQVGAYIVEVSNVGTQTEEKGAEIEKADAILYSGYVYWKYNETVSQIVFAKNTELGYTGQIYVRTFAYTRETRLLSATDNSLEVVNKSHIATIFSHMTTYNVGDLVWYTGKLYRCTTAHTGTWVAADFVETTISDAMKANEQICLDVITISGSSGTLDSATLAKVVANPQNFVFDNGGYILSFYQRESSQIYYARVSAANGNIDKAQLYITISNGVWNYGSFAQHDSTKQDTLVSGSNIKTINSEPLLGSGNITIRECYEYATNSDIDDMFA